MQIIAIDCAVSLNDNIDNPLLEPTFGCLYLGFGITRTLWKFSAVVYVTVSVVDEDNIIRFAYLYTLMIGSYSAYMPV